MQRKLFLTTPTNHKRGNGWGPLAIAIERTVRKAVHAAGGKDVEVEVGEAPVFGPGGDSEEALLRVEEEVLPGRAVRIDHWCSFVRYGTVCVTLGTGIRRSERRALLRALGKRALAKQGLIKEHTGAYAFDDGDVFAYALDPGAEDDRVTISHLLEPFDTTWYIGERWLLQGDDEHIEANDFEIVRTFGPNLVLFYARHHDAETRVWQASMHGDGLIALNPDDEQIKNIARDFAGHRDLAILTQGAATSLRVTIGRCQPADSLVVVYHPVFAPEIDTVPAFVV